MLLIDLTLRFILALIAFTFRGWIGWSGIVLVSLKIIGVIHWQWWVAALPLEYGVIYCLYITIDGALYRAGLKDVGCYARFTQGEQEYTKLVASQAQDAAKEQQQTGPASDESKIREEKLRTLLILNNRWPRSVIDYNVVGERVEVIDPQRKVLTVLSTAELEG